MSTEERGYLELPYLDTPYTGGEVDEHLGMQVNMIVNAATAYGFQTEMFVNATSPRGMQSLMQAQGSNIASLQINAIVNAIESYGMQANQDIAANPFEGMQANMIIAAAKALGIQVSATTSSVKDIGMQITGYLSGLTHMGMSVKADTLRHNLIGVYLEEGYLTGPYLVEQMNAYMGMQVELVNKVTEHLGMQVEGVVYKNLPVGMQAELIINASRAVGMQVDQITQMVIGMQATLVIYNTTQLRLMTIFPSRGTAALAGNNWTASSTGPGDVLPRNLNTDTVEQYYRSANGDTGSVELVCDTGLPQGVPVDTIAILGHNLTTSALVQVQGSNDNFATPPRITFNMMVERDNMYYIAPTLPTSAGQNRYWKFIFQDPTNTAGFIKVGTILFGAASIFSIEACFVQPLTKGFRHFKDEMPIEGFSTASNDRSLKKFIRLRFENLDFNKGNFAIIDEALNYARTSLKTLVIPTPEYSSRFAVFGKLAQMPELSFTDNGVDASYVSLDLEWDESK